MWGVFRKGLRVCWLKRGGKTYHSVVEHVWVSGNCFMFLSSRYISNHFSVFDHLHLVDRPWKSRLNMHNFTREVSALLEYCILTQCLYCISYGGNRRQIIFRYKAPLIRLLAFSSSPPVMNTRISWDFSINEMNHIIFIRILWSMTRHGLRLIRWLILASLLLESYERWWY